jgi:hypothetical protein
VTPEKECQQGKKKQCKEKKKYLAGDVGAGCRPQTMKI